MEALKTALELLPLFASIVAIVTGYYYTKARLAQVREEAASEAADRAETKSEELREIQDRLNVARKEELEQLAADNRNLKRRVQEAEADLRAQTIEHLAEKRYVRALVIFCRDHHLTPPERESEG